MFYYSHLIYFYGRMSVEYYCIFLFAGYVLRALKFLIVSLCVVWVVSLCVSPCEVTGLFRVDGSGSGDGDMEFFLPTTHKRGKQLFQGPLTVPHFHFSF